MFPYRLEKSWQSKTDRKQERRRAGTSGPRPNHNKSRLGFSPTHPDREKRRGRYLSGLKTIMGKSVKSAKTKMAKTATETLTGRWEADWDWLHHVSFLQVVSRVDKPFPYSWSVCAATCQHQYRSVRLKNNRVENNHRMCICSRVTNLLLRILPSCPFSSSSP